MSSVHADALTARVVVVILLDAPATAEQQLVGAFGPTIAVERSADVAVAS